MLLDTYGAQDSWPQMSTAPPLEGALEAGDLPGPRQRPVGPSLTVQEGAETFHRGLLGDRSETKAVSAEAGRGRGGCFLGFWLGWPKHRPECVWCPRGSERLRGEMAQGSAGLWADRLLSGSLLCLPDNPVVLGHLLPLCTEKY